MKKQLTGLTACVALLLAAHPAFALAIGDTVTKQTQAGMGLDFTLNAAQHGNEVSVDLQIPKSGKLTKVYDVFLEIDGDGKDPMLFAPLAMRTGPDGVTRVYFQMGQSLVGRCHIDLENEVGMLQHYYSVDLKGYVIDKKVSLQKKPTPLRGRNASSFAVLHADEPSAY